MNTNDEILTRQKVAESVQVALANHKVNPEQIGQTIDFLSQIIGGIIGTLFPSEKNENYFKQVMEDIEIGVEHGIPEE
jgi:hypothetical protein